MVLAVGNAFGQTYCTPAVLPYALSMPGISNVTFNTIDNDSPVLEDPGSNYINTGLSTTVARGLTYDFSMTYNVDAAICPDMNLRVWIDFNQNKDFSDAGELVISENDQLPGTYDGEIQIPASALLGATRMRVVSKMTANGGHILPSPCDIPQDPFGYHGGMEDYTLMIAAGTGVEASDAIMHVADIYPNPVTTQSRLTFSLARRENVQIDIFGINGEKAAGLAQGEMAEGLHSLSFAEGGIELAPGIYVLRLMAGREGQSIRFAVTE